MRLPRWTVFPALALLAVFLIPAIPRKEPIERAPDPGSVPTTRFRKVIVLGIDGMDPDLLRDTVEKFPGRMPNFARMIGESGIHALGTSIPPQSPVAWSNFTTGLDPGGHGIFDFIHRNPMTRDAVPCTTKATEPTNVALWGDWQFSLGGSSENNRTGRPFWQILADHGVPADVWRMPANFPVEPALGVSFSGMMTPALDSAYGQYSFYTTNPPAKSLVGEGKIIALREYTPGLIETYIAGPPNSFKQGSPHVTVPLRLYIDREASPASANANGDAPSNARAKGAVALDAGGHVIVLRPGQWSDFVTLSFPLLPMGLSDIQGVVRFYLRSIEPDVELYASPINIDPSAPIAPVSEPSDASADLAEAIGVYYTQGMPEDVNALKDKALTDEEFMAQADLVHDESQRMMDYAIDRYLQDGEGGFLFFYFSGVDLCSHMMWRHADDEHPSHDAQFAGADSSSWSKRENSTWKEVVADLYLRMDPVLGRLRERLGEDALYVVMSDHGFAPYRRKFSLNTWLYENGYLVLKAGLEKEKPRSDPEFAEVHVRNAADWSKTRAYGVGFNGLYLNLAGRELDDPETPENEAGIVRPGAEADALIAEIKAKLEALRDGSERPVLRCDVARDVYHGSRASEAPDLIVGYNSGYGNSDQASLGRITNAVLDDNLGGTFNGSHLMAPEVVPGVLLTNSRVLEGERRLEDLTVEILKQFGIAKPAEMRGAPVLR